jgi:Putative zinc-finger
VNEMEIAGYLDGGLPALEREAVEAHLAVCPDCRRDLLESKTVLNRVRRPRRLLVGSAAVAAAALLVIAVPTMRRDGVDPAASRMREAASPADVISYGPTGEVPISSIRFVWGAVRDAVTYRLTVTRSDAAPVWKFSGPDTAVALPDSILLVPGERYFWVTDVLLSDGTTRTTGMREFAPVR